VRALLTFALVLAAAAPVRAQDCAGGRVATPEGYCCWPRQRWDDTDQRCEGPPACPAPLSASGTECVGEGAPREETAPALPEMVHAEGPVDYGSGAASPSGAPAAAMQTGVAFSAWPMAGQIPPAGARNPRRVRRSDETMQIIGAVLLGAGYAGAVTESVFAFGSGGIWRAGRDTTCHDTIGALSLVPVLGGLFAWITAEACRVPTYVNAGGVAFRSGSVGIENEAGWALIGTLSSVVQLAGLGLLLGGSFSTVEATVYEGGSVSMQLSPWVAGGLGAQATVRF